MINSADYLGVNRKEEHEEAYLSFVTAEVLKRFIQQFFIISISGTVRARD